MTNDTVLSTCNEAGMIPLCAQNIHISRKECFKIPGVSLIALMEASYCGPTNFWKNADCFFLNYVIAYQKDKLLKAENSTDKTDEISWQIRNENVRLSGQDGKNFYALCQYVIPTTTTTTTTTEAPTTLSREEIEEYLTKTECPLTEKNIGHTTDLSSETKLGLPQIDLFLNPERKEELEELKLWVEKNEENLTYTEVRHSQQHKRIAHHHQLYCFHWYSSPGCPISNLPQPLQAALALYASMLPIQGQPRLCAHAHPLLLDGE